MKKASKLSGVRLWMASILSLQEGVELPIPESSALDPLHLH